MNPQATVEQGALDALASSVKTPLNSDGEVVVNQNTAQAAPAPVATPAATEAPKSDVPAVQQTEGKLSFGDDMPTLELSPKTVAKPIEALKVEDLVPAKEVSTAPLPEASNQAQQQPTPPARDYTIFPEEVAAELKKYPNLPFNAVKAHFEKAKQIEAEAAELRKGALPSSYYEHPQAYQFDRTYQQASQLYGKSTFESQHWQTQLGELRSGRAEKITNLVGYDEHGQPQYQELAVTPEIAGRLEAQIIQNLTQLAQVSQQAQQQAGYVRNQFAQQHSQTISYLKGAEDKFFPDLKDISKHPRKADYDFFTTQFLPPQMRNNPLASGLGKAYVAIVSRDAKIAELTKKLETYERNKAADALAGPSPSQMTGAVPSGKVAPVKGELSMAMFMKGDE